TRSYGDWSSDVCSSDLQRLAGVPRGADVLAPTALGARVEVEHLLPREVLERGRAQRRHLVGIGGLQRLHVDLDGPQLPPGLGVRSEEHTSELQSPYDLV